MSKLRPECVTSRDGTALPYETALFLIHASVARRRELIRGRLDGPKETHCAMGAFWADNPKASVLTGLVDEVAAVNDSLPPTASPQERWKFVNSWLRWKLQVLAGKTSKTKPDNVVPLIREKA
jgi:hypothetical protein